VPENKDRLLNMVINLTGKPLKAAHYDQTLPLCWNDIRPFRNIHEVRKYFKPMAVSFNSGA